jgi:hypothetical protein
MARAVFDRKKQIYFFEQLKLVSGLNTDLLGKKVGISGRSFRDWINGTTLPTVDGVESLSKLYHVKVPPILEIREENWSGRVYGRRGGLSYVKKYGSPGTIKGRIKGGKISQQNRRIDPEKYRKLGCKVANVFKITKKSPLLAEFIGIVLGDGGLTRSQCQITLNRKDDALYTKELIQIIQKLFAYKATLVSRKENAVIVVITGVNLIIYLEELGLVIGNKVKHQVDIPDWIKGNKSYLRSCIRGLFDTDGGTYTHIHKVNDKTYSNFEICFSNASLPLRESFSKALSAVNIKSSHIKHCVYVYNKADIQKFFEYFKPRNKKHLNRYLDFGLS